MKAHLKFLILLLTLFMGSCKDDVKVLCPEILQPMIIHINYVDESGKSLFFDDNPVYSIEDLYIYKIEYNEEFPIEFSADDNAKLITLSLNQSAKGTIFIQLGPEETDEINFIAEIDESDPCKKYVVTEVIQNNKKTNYDKQNDVWVLVK